MTFTTDNRWPMGDFGMAPPDEAYVAYGARWIDRGDSSPADIVPDRQGFAYETPASMGPLIDWLRTVDAANLHKELNFDVIETLYDGTDEEGFGLRLRRAGGYVYCSAWLQ